MSFRARLFRFTLFILLLIAIDFGIREDSSFIVQLGEKYTHDQITVYDANAHDRVLTKESIDKSIDGKNFTISYTMADYLEWDDEHSFGLNGTGDNISEAAANYMGNLVFAGQQLYDTGKATITIPSTIDSKQLLSDLSRLMNCVVGYRVDVNGTELRSEANQSSQLMLNISYKEDSTQSVDNPNETWRYSIESMVNAIVNTAKSQYKTVEEQLLFINDYLASECKYDTFSADNTDKVDDSAWSAYGCLVEGSAVCEGYTNAMTLILDALGIASIEEVGRTSDGQLHTWNKVYLDDTWLNIDVTSDSAKYNDVSNAIAKSMRRKFFLISDSELNSKGIEGSNTDLMLSWLIKFGDRNTDNAD